MSAAAQAGFLYLPQDEAPPVTVETAAVKPPGAAREQVRGPADESGAGLWQVRSGEMLRDAMSRWGRRAGVEVLFLTDRRYRLHEGRAFAGSFEDAAEALIAALAHMPHPPVAETRQGGRTYAVLHQASLYRASLHRASPYRAKRHRVWPDRVRPAGDGQ